MWDGAVQLFYLFIILLFIILFIHLFLPREDLYEQMDREHFSALLIPSDFTVLISLSLECCLFTNDVSPT